MTATGNTPNHLAQYQDIQEQIRVLNERATLLVMEGRAEAIDSIITMMKVYTITAEDIGVTAAPVKRNRGPSANPRPAKFRDPETGATWTGQGASPKWLEGKNRDEFKIEGSAP